MPNACKINKLFVVNGQEKFLLFCLCYLHDFQLTAFLDKLIVFRILSIMMLKSQ